MTRVEELEGLEKVLDAAMAQVPTIGGEGDVATQALAILVAAKAFTRAYRQAQFQAEGLKGSGDVQVP